MTFRSLFLHLFILIGFFFGFAPAVKAQNNITTQRVKGQKDCFTSPELDNLFGVKGKTYAFENLKKYDVKGQHVQLVRMHAETKKEERQLFLLLDETGSWKDTILFKGTENIAFFATLEGNKNAVCIGEFNASENQFYIDHIYELTDSKTFSKVPENRRIVACPMVVSEKAKQKPKHSVSSLPYTFSTLYSRRSYYSITADQSDPEGTWKLSCGNSKPVIYINNFGNVAISLDQQMMVDGNLTPDEQDSSAYLISFQGYLMHPEYEPNAYSDSISATDATIDKSQAIAKITILSENQLWLEWYGLFDTELSEYRFQLSDFIFYTENNRERPIVLKRCM